MRKQVTVYNLIIIVAAVVFASGLALANNDIVAKLKKGFRGIEWGTNLKAVQGMQAAPMYGAYIKANDKLSLGNIPLQAVLYIPSRESNDFVGSLLLAQRSDFQNLAQFVVNNISDKYTQFSTNKEAGYKWSLPGVAIEVSYSHRGNSSSMFIYPLKADSGEGI